MFDPKHESKLLKVHNSRDVIACSNSNLMIRYFHRYRHALLGLPRIGGGSRPPPSPSKYDLAGGD